MKREENSERINKIFSKYNNTKGFVFKNTDTYGFIAEKNITNDYFPPLFFSEKRELKNFTRNYDNRKKIFKGISLREKNIYWPLLVNKYTRKCDFQNDNSELKYSLKKLFRCADCEFNFFRKTRPERKISDIRIFYDENEIDAKTVIQIHLDVQRTFCTHVLFCEKYGFGQKILFKMLVDLASFLPSIEYCQGLSSICAVLLMYVEKNSALNLIIFFIKLNEIEGLFDKKLSGFPEILAAQREILCLFLKKLYNHVEKYFDISSLICRWFVSLFSHFKIELVTRIYDLMFYFGFPVLFLVTVAILRINEKLILELKNEQLILFLNNLESREFDVEKIVKIIEKNLMKFSVLKIKSILKKN